MRTIHIGISHDNNLMIPQLGNIKILMNSCSKRRDHSLDLRIGVNLIQPCFFYIQDFSSQWKDRLCRTAVSLSLQNHPLNLPRRCRSHSFPGFLSEQSASFPGRDIPSRADFLLVRSLAFLAASLALCAIRDFSTVCFATDGFCSRKISS